MRRGAGGNAIVRPRRVMPTPATVTRRPRIRRLCFVARSCSPQSSSGVADARLSRLVMVATSHCLGLRPCVEVDRTSVVYGKSVSVRFDIGGRRIIKKKKKIKHKLNKTEKKKS